MRLTGGVPQLLAGVAVAFAIHAAANAAPPSIGSDPWRLCAEAILRQERRGLTPRHLLTAIALNESGRAHPGTGTRLAWPWAVMAEGRGRYLATKAEAIAEVRELQARGVRNIDVGCMQINLMYHPDAFASLEAAFDPATNVAYAAAYLGELFDELGSWEEAAGRYHSATPMHKIPYQNRVIATWDRQRENAAAGDRDPFDLAALPPPSGIAGAAIARRSGSPGEGGPSLRPPQMPQMPQMPMVRRGQAAPVLAPRDQPGLVRLTPPKAATAAAAARNSAGEAEFAARRMQYLQAWRANRGAAPEGPVTVVRGTAESVYSFDIR